MHEQILFKIMMHLTFTASISITALHIPFLNVCTRLVLCHPLVPRPISFRCSQNCSRYNLALLCLRCPTLPAGGKKNKMKSSNLHQCTKQQAISFLNSTEKLN